MSTKAITPSKRHELIESKWNDAHNAERKSDADRLSGFVSKWKSFANEMIDAVVVVVNDNADPADVVNRQEVINDYTKYAKVAVKNESKSMTTLVNDIDLTFGIGAKRQSETSRAMAFIKYESTKDKRTVAEFVRLHKDHDYGDLKAPKIGIASYAKWLRAVSGDSYDLKTVDSDGRLLGTDSGSGGGSGTSEWKLKEVPEQFTKLLKSHNVKATKRQVFDVAGLFDGDDYDHESAIEQVNDMIAELAAWIVLNENGRIDSETGLVK